MSVIQVQTRPCMHCGRRAVLEVDEAGFAAWQAGEFVQVALPGLSADERELLISGTHPQCFVALFGTEDDPVEELF